jgi:hypothetical protein
MPPPTPQGHASTRLHARHPTRPCPRPCPHPQACPARCSPSWPPPCSCWMRSPTPRLCSRPLLQPPPRRRGWKCSRRPQRPSARR